MDIFDSNFNDTDYYYYYDYDMQNDTMFEWLYPLPRSATKRMISWIVIWIGFPLTLLAIYSLYSLVNKNHVAPVYVINLLISDVIQICCLVCWVSGHWGHLYIFVSKCFYYIGVLASVGFMLCVALERYLVVAWPLWYRFKRTIKSSVLVAVIVWILCVIEVLVLLTSDVMLIFHSIFLLLPFPVLIFCLLGTLKSLSSSISVNPKEKRRIVGTLVLVVLNYSVMYLPWVIWLLSRGNSFEIVYNESVPYLSFLQFSPLADLVLYVFMKKGAVDKLLASLCCCRMTGDEEQSQVTASNEKNTEDVSSV